MAIPIVYGLAEKHLDRSHEEDGAHGDQAVAAPAGRVALALQCAEGSAELRQLGWVCFVSPPRRVLGRGFGVHGENCVQVFRTCEELVHTKVLVLPISGAPARTPGSSLGYRRGRAVGDRVLDALLWKISGPTHFRAVPATRASAPCPPTREFLCCKFVPFANTALLRSHRIRPKRGSAVSSARSARDAWTRCCAMSAPIAAGASQLGLYGPRGTGAARIFWGATRRRRRRCTGRSMQRRMPPSPRR